MNVFAIVFATPTTALSPYKQSMLICLCVIDNECEENASTNVSYKYTTNSGKI